MTRDATPHTRDDLTTQLRELGVAPGDTLFVHASYKALGPLADGVETILAALIDAVDPAAGGLILMPAFNLIKGDRSANWDPATTPSMTGYVTEAFRTRPGTFRSDCPVHTVCAAGHDAEAMTSEHHLTTGYLSPWDYDGYGRDWGEGSPMVKAYDRPQAKVLMLGVDYYSSTYCHFVEVLHYNERLRTDPDAAYIFLNRVDLGAYWESLGRLRHGPVGSAPARLFPIRDFVDTLLAACRHEPHRLGPDNTQRLAGDA